MIAYALVDRTTGAIAQTGAAPDRAHLDMLADSTGMAAVETDESIGQETHYWTGKRFAAYPTPRPDAWATWDGKGWIDPRSDEERAAGDAYAHRAARVTRDRLLTESDWTQLPDAPLTKEQRQAWRDYRQALRNVPATGAWPDKPE